jgi:protein SCO1/2
VTRTRYPLAILIACALLAALAAGCGWFGAKKDVRTYELEGRVVSVDRRAKQVVVAHEEIPGLMKAMTMGFPLKNERDVDRVQPNDRIAGTLYVEDDRSYLEILVIQRGPEDESGEAAPETSEGPKSGDAVPDVALVDHDGRPLKLSDLRGRIYAVTFIYTRCPLPDFCPRMDKNFAEAARQLQADAGAAARYQLLSVSFDTEYDTPAVLKQYRARYRRTEPAGAVPWSFATGTAGDVRKLATFFGLTYTGEGAELVHTLRTAVIDGDGRVVRVFTGNQWTSEELVAALRGA